MQLPEVSLVLRVTKLVLLADIIVDVLKLVLDIVTVHPVHALGINREV
jgi:hypothetical protein